MIRRRSLLAAPLLPLPARADAPWRRLPPTPFLPEGARAGLLPVPGGHLWYALWGPSSAPPLLLLHGGLANTCYWGAQIPTLAATHRVIGLDTRGQGRSGSDARPFSYALFAADALALLDHLGLRRAAILGWSDGAITGLHLALHHPARTERLYALAANADATGLAPDPARQPAYAAYLARTREEYRRLAPEPAAWPATRAALGRMWQSEPRFTAAELARLSVPVRLAAGDHDEVIRAPHTRALARAIPRASLRFFAGLGHFAMLQDPPRFTDDVRHFLA